MMAIFSAIPSCFSISARGGASRSIIFFLLSFSYLAPVGLPDLIELTRGSEIRRWTGVEEQ